MNATSRLRSVTTGRVARLWLTLAMIVGGCTTSSDVSELDATGPDDLPGGAVAAARGAGPDDAPVLVEGPRTIPTAGRLTAAAGTINLTLAADEAWGDETEQTLVHLGDAEGAPVSLTAARGRLHARYDAGRGRAANLTYRARNWDPGDRREVRFAWQADGDTLLAWLMVDGELVALEPGDVIDAWPATAVVGEGVGGEGAGGGGGAAIVHHVALSTVVTLPAELAPARRTIRVDASQRGDRLHSFWHVANFALWDGYTFTQPDAHAILMGRAPFTREVIVDFTLGGRFRDGGEMYLGVDDEGEALTDFTTMLTRVRGVVDAGLTPWIMLEKVPPAMSDPPEWRAYGNTAPPADFELWHRYVQAAVAALVDEFGRETVAGWRFMVATEPDLHPSHWAGTREQFLHHLDYTLDAVTRVLPEAEVSPGNILNPAFAHAYRDTWGTDAVADHVRSRDQWGLDIIDHAATGTNAVTGETGTRVDFFSASWYIRVGMDNDAFDRAVETMRARLDRYPALEGTPIDIREFSVLSDERGRRLYAGDASEWSASFYASIARRAYDHDVRVIFEWDHATFGVLHPRGQVMAMLERMVEGERLAVALDADSPADAGAIAAEKDGRLFVLIYHHRPQRHAGGVETIDLEIAHPDMADGGSWRLSEWTVDAERTVWVHAFSADAEAAGLERLENAGNHEASPRRLYGDEATALFQANIERYQELAELPRTRSDVEVAVEDGRIRMELAMPAHSVRLLELTPGR